MTCTSPVKIKIPSGATMLAPCNLCMSCRILKANEWAVKMMAEAECHPYSVFLTLTYDEDHLPINNSLDSQELKNFIRRFKRAVGRNIRYYACGEYGKDDRPHYHLILFNAKMQDFKILKKRDKKGYYVCHKAWEKGFMTAGYATYDSCRYTAKYITKTIKIVGTKNPYYPREKPFQRFSKSLGKKWAMKNAKVLTEDLCVSLKGKNVGLPKSFKNILDIDTKELYKRSLNKKIWFDERCIGMNSAEVVEERERILKQRDKNLKKKIDIYERGEL